MKHYIYILFCLNSLCLKSWALNDTTKVDIGITTYPFAYNMKMTVGSIAIGPSVFLFNNKRFTIQLSLLYDFKKYLYYEHSTHLQNDLVAGRNIFFPISFHYTYYKNKKINCFVSSGIIFGGRFYLDEKNSTETASSISLIAGTGVSYNIFKRVYMRISPVARYSEGFYPGLLFDLSIRLKQSKNQ